jgi:hypothetical protein
LKNIRMAAAFVLALGILFAANNLVSPHHSHRAATHVLATPVLCCGDGSLSGNS